MTTKLGFTADLKTCSLKAAFVNDKFKTENCKKQILQNF